MNIETKQYENTTKQLAYLRGRLDGTGTMATDLYQKMTAFLTPIFFGMIGLAFVKNTAWPLLVAVAVFALICFCFVLWSKIVNEHRALEASDNSAAQPVSTPTGDKP